MLALLLIAAAVAGDDRARDARPGLSGPEQRATAGRFAVHYTTEGGDAVLGGDADADGVPDAVPRVLAALEDAEGIYLTDGWRPILADDGDGGGPEIDVYLVDVDINGYSVPVDVGASPATSCFIEIDPHRGADPGLILESVAVHELHHCVQFAYTDYADSWIYEATSTYEQYRITADDPLELALGVLWQSRLGGADRAIDDTGDRFEYAAFAWVKFWTEFRGARVGRGPELWETIAAEGDWRAATESEAQRNWGLSFEQTYLEHAVWNAFACANDDGQHYDPLTHRCVLAASIEVVPAVDTIDLAQTHGPYATVYAEVAAAGDPRPIALDCAGPGVGARAGVALVTVDAAGLAGEEVTAWSSESDPLTVRLAAAIPADGSVRIALVSTGATPAVHRCDVTRVDPVPEPRRGLSCATVPVDRGSWPFLAAAAFQLLRSRRSFRDPSRRMLAPLRLARGATE